MPAARTDIDPQEVAKLYLTGLTADEIAAKFDTCTSLVLGRLDAAGVARRPRKTRQNPTKRFWRKVNKSGPIQIHVPALGNCWEWTGRTASRKFKYGVFMVDGREVLAHRYAYQLEYGPIPEAMCVLHACDNAKCVRGSHLFIGTKTDNNLDRDRKGRQAWGERGRAKLTAPEVATIRRTVTIGGVPFTTLARRYEVSLATIYRLARGKGWIEPRRLAA